MMKRSMIASGVLHAVVIVAATVAWPHAIEQSEEVPSVVPVDLVTIADVTNIAPSAPEPQKLETPPPEPVPPPPAAAPPPPPQAEVAPIEPDKAPPPKEEQKNASAPPNPVRPRRKPAPDQKFDVDTVIALLDKRAPRPAPPPPPNAKPAETTVKGLGAQDAFTMDLKDALAAQMYRCWHPDVGAPNPEQLIPQVRVFLAQDGSLVQPPSLEPASRSAAAANPYMRSAGEAALRAVRECEPYKGLPPNKYDDWREIVMTFDPRKMIGR
jgi:colicin import membrane protein